MDLGLKDKVAIITGGSRGVGRGIARAFAAEGVKLVLTARRANLLDETADEIRKEYGVEVLTVPADMGVAEDIKGMVQQAIDKFGRVDILVNNAASFSYGSMFELTDADWLNHFNNKTFGYLRCMREVVPHMQKNHWGRIINIAGGASRQAGLGQGGGSAGATNAAIINISKSMSDVLAKDGITVNVVHPGAADSDREELRVAWMAETSGRPKEQIEAELARNVPPIGRKVVSSDTGALVTLLVSEQMEALTGQTIAIDGGGSRAIIY